MDTKLKSSRIAGVIVSLVLIFALSFGMIGAYSSLYERKENFKNTFFDSNYFLYTLYEGSFGLYWNLMKQETGENLTPAEAYVPEFVEKTEALRPETAPGSASTDVGDYETGAAEGLDSAESEYYERRQTIEDINNNVEYTYNSLVNEMQNLEYLVIDKETKATLTNSQTDLSSFLSSAGKTPSFLENYRYVVALEFDETGRLTLLDSYGGGADTSHSDEIIKTFKTGGNADLNLMSAGAVFDIDDVVGPTNTTIVYAVPQRLIAYDWLHYQVQWEDQRAFQKAGFIPLCLGAMVLCAVLGVVLGLKKSWNLGRGPVIRRLPLELLLAGVCFAIAAVSPLAELALGTASGSIQENMKTYYYLSRDLSSFLAYGLNLAAWVAVLGTVYISFLSFVQVFRMGLWGYLKERSWCIRILRWLLGLCKKAYHAVTDINLTKPVRRTILKIILFNFVILLIISSLWVFGIFLLIVYSIVLYFILKKYFVQLQSDYNVLLQATGKMADGNLDVQITEDVGVFNPLKDELKQIQTGFKKAVDMEVKSQNMKTELITNVSHDLKTPLTAIITYVDLLKDETISEEDRKSYIETLDKKSQRLKQLIEDLFEVSKASSKNVTMDFAEVDLCSLIKQVQYELAEKIDASTIEFRWNLPDHKVLLVLDGQRTCRIFENLIVNITKYGMPNTRAYVDVTDDGKYVKVVLKNISVSEMNFTEEEITDRFVRGDKSRNTEGSGLGLAIVKSFVELQNGTFTISVDGDLFKAEIVWPKAPGPAMVPQKQ